jgi:hypothetical protein
LAEDHFNISLGSCGFQFDHLVSLSHLNLQGKYNTIWKHVSTLFENFFMVILPIRLC